MNGPDWILIVDDDEDTREMVILLLGLEGFLVRGAEDGLAAFDQIRAHGRPALILLDMRMPRMNGPDFARAMRRDPALAKVPIVVLTGDATSLSSAEILGAADWLIKPVDLSRLVALAGGVVAPAAIPQAPAPP